MKVFCISLPEKQDLRSRLSNLIEYFKDDFEFFDGVRLTESEWKNLIITNYISPFYKGGRKDFKQLIGECGAWVAHKNLWQHIASNRISRALIIEDGSIFHSDQFSEEPTTDQITFVNKEFSTVNGRLCGFGLNGYIIGYKSAKRLLDLTKSINLPLDLMVRQLCNDSLLTWSTRPWYIEKDRTVPHSTSDQLIDQNNDFSSKQDFRTLLERFFFNDLAVLKRDKPKIAFCATHPHLGTGYAKVGYHLTKELSKYYTVLYLGFQNNNSITEGRDLSHMKVFDLAKLAPGSPGNFGFPAIPQILKDEKPDVLMIYNDCAIIQEILSKNTDFSGKRIVYLDLVYDYHHKAKLDYVRENTDHVFTFTEYFKNHLIESFDYSSSKVSVLPHGIDYSDSNWNMSKEFIVLNINRNSYRKRLDMTIESFLDFWKLTNYADGIKLQLSCHMNSADGLDILEFMGIMCKKHNKTFEFLSKAILNTTAPCQLPDHVVDNHYKTATVGITTSSGEGWGLFAHQFASLGKPLISTDISAHKEILKDYTNVSWITRVGHYYQNDLLKGYIPTYDPTDFTRALFYYYADFIKGNLKQVDGSSLKTEYSWDTITKKFVNSLNEILC